MRNRPVSDNAMPVAFDFFSPVTNLTTSIMLNREGIGAAPFPLHDEFDLSDLILADLLQIQNSTNLYTDFPESRGISAAAPSPLGIRIERGTVANVRVEHVLEYLQKAEWKAPIGERDDIRVAYITVIKAFEGHPDPFAIAFWQYFSASPDQLIPFFAARAELWRNYDQRTMSVLDRYLPLRYSSDWREVVERIECELAIAKKPCGSVKVMAKAMAKKAGAM